MGSMTSGVQTTLRERVVLSGIGVHGGKPVRMALVPADPGTGIVFVRAVGENAEVEIPATSASVTSTELCTVLGDPAAGCVATVEHLMAALAALGVDNLQIEIDGPEVPVMDGSAECFVEAIDRVGLVGQGAPRRFIEILKPVRVEAGAAFAEFLPHNGCRFEVSIDYDCPVIGRQAMAIEITPKSFRREIARARTYGYMRDVERLWAAGYALGSSLENSVVIGDGKVVNPEGLRYPDEFVRHKVLDSIGDLALAGAPIRGLYRSHKGGHKVNAMALQALFATKGAWRAVSAPERPARGQEGGVELSGGFLVPAYAPDIS